MATSVIENLQQRVYANSSVDASNRQCIYKYARIGRVVMVSIQARGQYSPNEKICDAYWVPSYTQSVYANDSSYNCFGASVDTEGKIYHTSGSAKTNINIVGFYIID